MKLFKSGFVEDAFTKPDYDYKSFDSWETSLIPAKRTKALALNDMILIAMVWQQ